MDVLMGGTGISDRRRAELERAEVLTEDDVRVAVSRLPREIRDWLAEGPRSYRYACTVCDAFRSCDLARGLDDDPRWVVFNYHEVPKLRMQRAEDQWHGPLAAEVYERCQVIYQAAGSTARE